MWESIPPPGEDPGTPAMETLLVPSSEIPRREILAEHRALKDDNATAASNATSKDLRETIGCLREEMLLELNFLLFAQICSYISVDEHINEWLVLP